MKVVERGRIRNDLVAEYVIRSRTPELNRLDLMAQVAANRLYGQRIDELCDRFGREVFQASLERLLDSTEAHLRTRLRSLPDGRWRHVGHMEHDGVIDAVYRVALTDDEKPMTASSWTSPRAPTRHKGSSTRRTERCARSRSSP